MTLRLIFLSDKMIGGYSAYSKVTYQCCTRLAKLGHKVAHIPMMRANRMGKQAYQDVLIYPSGDQPFAEDVTISHYVDWKADMLHACMQAKKTKKQVSVGQSIADLTAVLEARKREEAEE